MSPVRRLPGFVVAGVPRAGTTTVRSHLRAHPDVFLPARKEMHYFTLNRHRGLGWYADHYRDAAATQVCGDVTPTYLLHPQAVRALARELSDVRVIVVLRDPVARAYSHFWHNQWKGIERLDFEGALSAEPSRLQRDPSNSPLAYAASGEYARLLRELYALVPPEQVQLVLFDDLVADPGAELARICDHIGVAPPAGPTERQRTNHHGPVRSVWASTVARHLPGPACRTLRRWNTSSGEYPAMAEATRARLTDRLAADHEDLVRLLGRDLPWTVDATT